MNGTLMANSLIVASATTVLALAWGFAIAVLMALAAPAWRRCLIVLTVVVLALPAFVVVNCWIDLLGTQGALRRIIDWNIFSISGTAWTLALLLWPIPALAIDSAWRQLEPIHFEVDPALRGYSLLRLLLWPTARKSAITSAAIVFALALNNFAVPAILQVKTLPAHMWVQFNTNLDATAALKAGWPMIALPLALLVGLRHTSFTWPRETHATYRDAMRRQLGRVWSGIATALAVMALVLSVVIPAAELAGSTRTWREFVPALQAGSGALFNSLSYAAAASGLTVAVGLILARVPRMSWLWLFFLTPGVLIGIGALQLFQHPSLDFFSRTGAIVVALLVLRHLALTRAIHRSAMEQVDPALVDSARLDGARGWRLFRWIVFPQIRTPVLMSAYVVYLLCLWDVETILLVVPPDGETLALRIFNLLHYGHNAHVNALCLLLLLIALAPLLVYALLRFLLRSRNSRFALLAGLAIGMTGCNQPAPTADSAPLESKFFSRVQTIGSRGTGPGQFNKPRSLTVDTNGFLFVVDLTGRVQKFSPEGQFLLSWQMPQTDLGKPKGMACDRDGLVVIVEPHYQRVNHFTPDGQLVRQWGGRGTNAGELTLPRAIAVDTKNNVIVSEYTLVDRVQKFSARGSQWLAAWGTPGVAAGEFNRAEGVTTDLQDRIYVADSCNHRIQVFSPSGQFLRSYGRAGERRGELSYPYDVAVDEAGNQFVCEFGNSRIQVFDREGRSLEFIGKPGGEPGQFANPWSIALDREGNLYVADSMNHRVQKLLRRKAT